MNCMECGAEIPPAFKAAIISNVCPGCGGQIMNDEAVTLLTELKEAMARMPNDPEGLAGWLLSNYQMRKIGDAQPTLFHGKNVTKGAAMSRENLKVHDNTLQKFYKKAGITDITQIEPAVLDDGDTVEEDDVNEAVKDPEYTLAAVKAMAGNFQKKAVSQKDVEEIANALNINTNDDVSDLPPALQADKLNRLLKQRELSQGGSIGLVRRK